MCLVQALLLLSFAMRFMQHSAVHAGVWGNLVRQWLDELLPADAAELCRY